MRFIVGTSSDPDAVMRISQEAGHLKRRSVPVFFGMKLSDTKLLFVEIHSDSQSMMSQFKQVESLANMTKEILPLWTELQQVFLNCTPTAELKAVFDKMPTHVSTTFLGLADAPGKMTARCKGTTLYYVRVLCLKVAAGEMARFKKLAAELLALTNKDEHTSQLIPVDDTTLCLVEINTPEHWVAAAKKYKSDAKFEEMSKASSALVESVQCWYAGAPAPADCPLAAGLPGTGLTADSTFVGWI